MKKRAIAHFMNGIMISFTIEMIVITLAVLVGGGDSLPVSLICQVFGLAVSCAVIGTIFYSDKLSFRMQTVFTYIFTLITVLAFAYTFQWEGMGDGLFTGTSFLVIIISLFTVGYSLTMTFIWLYQKKMKKQLNDKLTEFQQELRIKEEE